MEHHFFGQAHSLGSTGAACYSPDKSVSGDVSLVNYEGQVSRTCTRTPRWYCLYWCKMSAKLLDSSFMGDNLIFTLEIKGSDYVHKEGVMSGFELMICAVGS